MYLTLDFAHDRLGRLVMVSFHSVRPSSRTGAALPRGILGSAAGRTAVSPARAHETLGNPERD